MDRAMEKLMQNPRNSAILRHELLQKFGNACAICGVTDDVTPLNLIHLPHVSSSGLTTEENFIILCSNCHHTFDQQPKEYEFVSFLAEILNLHPDFSKVQQEVLLGSKIRYRADIIVNRQNNGRTNNLLIECKSYVLITSAQIHQVISQIKNYQATLDDCQLVLAVPYTIIEPHRETLKAANIEVWDLRYIAEQFSNQIKNASHSYFKALLLAILAKSQKRSREQEFLDLLSSCLPGNKDWSVYQKLVGEILEHLFTPPLGRPIPELSDKSQVNRRDFIMPNYSDKGFWAFLREKYEADYIVIDAKNYAKKIKKNQILQLANYLKPHGAGLFGLIVSRKGGDSGGCEHTLREQWLVHRKLILVLDDDDIRAMLLAKSDGRQPEDIIGQKIEHFRLSM
jgi:hypothetical protein